MRSRSWALALMVIAGVLGFSRTGSACSCVYGGPACQIYWKAEAVFEATVVSISPLPRTESISGRDYTFTDKLVRLNVHRSWKGPQVGPLDVTTSGNGASCGFDFKEGERYLVFAHRGRDAARWGVSSCSGTQRFDGSGPTADFLASLEKPATGGRVFGTVRSWHRLFDPERYRREVPTETSVRLVGAGQEWVAKSSGGSFEFTGLPRGRYRVEVETPDGYTTYSRARDVELPEERACAEESFTFAPDGRIAGRLVGTDGRGLKDVSVEVTGSEARVHPTYGLSIESDKTDADGFFEIRNLPPGRYVVGVNLTDLPNRCNPYARTVYPDASADPHVIELALGQIADLGTWHVPPPLPVARVTGVITYADGRPAGGTYVGAWDVTGAPVGRARGAGGTAAEPDGRFVLDLRQGRVYTFMARDKGGKIVRIKAPRIETTAEPSAPIHIVILDAQSR